MEGVDEIGRAASAAVLASLGAAGVFEALTVLSTQGKTAWAASPWRDDPYHTVVSVAQFTVPMFASVIALRLLAWRAPGGLDRAQQTVRAAWAMTALIGLTLASEWVAVIGRSSVVSRGTWTAVLIIGLTAASALNVTVAALLVRCRRRDSLGRWRHDWLDDVVFVCRSIPVLRRWASPGVAAWARRRAMTVFVALSTMAAAAGTGFQAVGERWTDPLLIAWLLIVETTSNLAFCVIANGVAGFIARPPRTRPRRIAEASAVAGCLAILVAIAFHDRLWRAFAAGPLTAGTLAALTLGAGLATSLVTAAVLLARAPRPTPPDRDVASA